MAVGLLGSFARTAKYLSVVVASGNMCRHKVHSAKWNRRGAVSAGGVGADISKDYNSAKEYIGIMLRLFADQWPCSNILVLYSA